MRDRPAAVPTALVDRSAAPSEPRTAKASVAITSRRMGRRAVRTMRSLMRRCLIQKRLTNSAQETLTNTNTLYPLSLATACFGSPMHRPVLSILRCENRQQAVGTRRVHQPGHGRARAGTAGTPLTADLQDKRVRDCPRVYAVTMVRRGSTVRVRQRASENDLQMRVLRRLVCKRFGGGGYQTGTSASQAPLETGRFRRDRRPCALTLTESHLLHWRQ
jgi:hypothetical protein